MENHLMFFINKICLSVIFDVYNCSFAWLGMELYGLNIFIQY